LPINFGVVILEPGETKNEVLLAETRNCKEHFLQMCVVSKDYINYLSNFPSLIWRAVYIKHWHWMRDLLSVDFLCLDKVSIDKTAYGSRIQ